MTPQAGTNDEYLTSVESAFQSSWNIPLWVWIVCALAAGALCFALYSSERGTASQWIRGWLAVLRLSLILSVLWMLGGWNVLQYETELPELAVVLDTSASMATPDAEAEGAESQSRIDQARRLLGSIRRGSEKQLSERYQLRWFTIDDALRASPSLFDQATLDDIAATGTQSKLGQGLRALIDRQSGRGTAAVVFLSDGINTAGPDLLQVERAGRTAAIPFYCVALGSRQMLPDLKLTDLLMDREVYFGDRISAEVAVVAQGLSAPTVRLRMLDESSGRVLDETQLELGADELQRVVRLNFVPERAGEIPIKIEVVPVEGETDLANNVVTQTVAVRDKTLRVLLVQQQPSYEFRFLKHLLERSRQVGDQQAASFQLYSVLQDGDPVYVEQDDSAIRLVPSSQDQLAQIDVFIFGRFAPDLLSRRSQQLIYDMVTEGGAGCLFVYGNGTPARELRGWPLGQLLPFQENSSSTAQYEGSLTWQPTAMGTSALPLQLAATERQSLEIWQQLPPFGSLPAIGELKLGAQVLAEAAGSGPTQPVLVTQYAGAGRVAFQGTDETYRWTSFNGSDTYHQRYWGQLLRWLSRGKLNQASEQSTVTVEPQKAKYGQPIRFQVRLGSEIAQGDLPPAVKLMVSSDRTGQSLTLPVTPQSNRLFQTTFENLAPGNYRALLVQPVTDSSSSQDFVVSVPPGEQAELRTNVEGLKSLAAATRGRFYLAGEANRLFEELPTGKSTRLGALPPLPLWNQWWVALLFAGLITMEWLLRRRARML